MRDGCEHEAPNLLPPARLVPSRFSSSSMNVFRTIEEPSTANHKLRTILLTIHLGHHRQCQQQRLDVIGAPGRLSRRYQIVPKLFVNAIQTVLSPAHKPNSKISRSCQTAPRTVARDVTERQPPNSKVDLELMYFPGSCPVQSRLALPSC